MTRFRRCPVVITAAVVGVSAVAVALYYFWRQRKDEKKSPEISAQPTESSSSASSNVPQSSDSEPRVGAGQDDSCTDMFKFSDENVRRVCERLFLEQMDLGEAYMEDAATVERGAMHLANAIALTGETEPLLKVLRKGMAPENFACIQKYIPTAEMRVNQLLQDELTIDSIAENFG